MLRLAVERQFEIDGEAARRVSDYDPAMAESIPGLREAIGLRNVIAHGYDDLDYGELWSTINSSLKDLHRVTGDLLDAAE